MLDLPPRLTSVWRIARQLWYGLFGHLEIEFVFFYSDALAAHGLGGGEGGSGAGERVEDDAFAEGQHATNVRAQEGLGLAAGLRRKAWWVAGWIDPGRPGRPGVGAVFRRRVV